MLYDLLDVNKAIIATVNVSKDWAQSIVGKEFRGIQVVSVELSEEAKLENRRVQRALQFSTTIDKMNTYWHNGLTTEQQERLNDWRTEWLDYPSTGVFPTIEVSDIFTDAHTCVEMINYELKIRS
jgi:hypothetical protein